MAKPTCCTRAYEPARFRAGTRRTVAFSIIFGALAFILITILLSTFNPDNESAKSALNTIMPLSAGFIGSIMAFYFSDEAGDDTNEEEEKTPAISSRTIIFKRDGAPSVDYKFDPNNLDGAKTMKFVLDEADKDPENGVSLLNPNEAEDGSKVFFFSFMENLRTQKKSMEEFSLMTLSELSKKMSGNIVVIKISYESEDLLGK